MILMFAVISNRSFQLSPSNGQGVSKATILDGIELADDLSAPPHFSLFNCLVFTNLDKELTIK